MLNRVVLVGRLTRDPDLRQTTTGVSVATFTIAVNRTFANQAGEREADFIQCVVWRKSAENVARYVSKGSLVGVDGRIQTRSYDAQDGSKRYVTEVVADSVQFLESRSAATRQVDDNQFGQPPVQTQSQAPTGNVEFNFDDDNSFDISDDDLPF
jgi:single stranded DNA-binding protein (ssb)